MNRKLAVLAVALPLVLGVAFGIIGVGLLIRDSEPEPDRIVSISKRCTDPGTNATVRSGGSVIQRGSFGRTPEPQLPDVVIPGRPPLERVGDYCEPGKLNARQEVTVRTSSGNTYVVEVPMEQAVRVGDNWPPE